MVCSAKAFSRRPCKRECNGRGRKEEVRVEVKIRGDPKNLNLADLHNLFGRVSFERSILLHVPSYTSLQVLEIQASLKFLYQLGRLFLFSLSY